MKSPGIKYSRGKMSIQIIPTKEEFEIIKTIAAAAADSAYFKSMGGFPGVLSIALYAREMGIPPLSALFGGMQNVMGKIQMSPEMMMSLIRGKGHKIEILEDSDVICKIRGTRKDTGETYTSSYTIGDAQSAGLVKQGSGWTKNPSDMLFARASGRLKRRLFPDVATKAYVEGELEEVQAEKTIEMESVHHRADDNKENPVVKDNLITEEQAKELDEMIGEDMEYRQALYNWLKISDMRYLPEGRYAKIYAHVVKHNEKKIHDEIANKKIEEENAEIN